MKRREFSTGTRALTNAYAAIALTNTPAVDNRSAEFPWDCWLDRVEVALTAIAGGASRVSCILTADAAGDQIVSREDTQPIVFGRTTPSRGTAILDVSGYYPRSSYSTLGTIYAWIKLDAGTATAVARAIHEQQHD